MKEFINTISPYLKLVEGLSFLAAIALVFISIRALSQIEVAKKSLKTQSIRDSRKIAAEYVYIYLDKIMTKRRDIQVTRDQVKMLEGFYFSTDDDDGLDVKKITANNKRLRLETRKQKDAYVKKIRASYAPYSAFLNDLEAFCAGVTSGIMDEETLYRAIGISFVSAIKTEKLDQVLLHAELTKGYYKNVTQVLKLWQLRLSIAELEKVDVDYDKIGERLADMRIELSKARTQAIPVIGVNSD